MYTKPSGSGVESDVKFGLRKIRYTCVGSG